MAVLLRRRGCNTHIVQMVRKYNMEKESLNITYFVVYSYVVQYFTSNTYLSTGLILICSISRGEVVGIASRLEA
jgi:cytochrome c oxidase subunit IV